MVTITSFLYKVQWTSHILPCFRRSVPQLKASCPSCLLTERVCARRWRCKLSCRSFQFMAGLEFGLASFFSFWLVWRSAIRWVSQFHCSDSFHSNMRVIHLAKVLLRKIYSDRPSLESRFFQPGLLNCWFFCLIQLVKYLTRFTDETFTTFISIGFQVEAFKVHLLWGDQALSYSLSCSLQSVEVTKLGKIAVYSISQKWWGSDSAILQVIGNLFKPTSPFPIETALLSLVLAGGTYVVAKLLTQVCLQPDIYTVYKALWVCCVVNWPTSRPRSPSAESLETC